MRTVRVPGRLRADPVVGLARPFRRGGDSAVAWGHPGSVAASSNAARRSSPTTPSNETTALTSERTGGASSPSPSPFSSPFSSPSPFSFTYASQDTGGSKTVARSMVTASATVASAGSSPPLRATSARRPLGRTGGRPRRPSPVPSPVKSLPRVLGWSRRRDAPRDRRGGPSTSRRRARVPRRSSRGVGRRWIP